MRAFSSFGRVSYSWRVRGQSLLRGTGLSVSDQVVSGMEVKSRSILYQSCELIGSSTYSSSDGGGGGCVYACGYSD